MPRQFEVLEQRRNQAAYARASAIESPSKFRRPFGIFIEAIEHGGIQQAGEYIRLLAKIEQDRGDKFIV